MRLPIIAGNWKMHTTVEEAVALVREMRQELLNATSQVEIVLCPPFVSVAAVAAEVRGTPIKLGAQNMHHEDRGAYTGEVSPAMLAPLCDYVILGHSERRQYFGETDQGVSKKIPAALRHGLKPILCVGENLAQNEAGRTLEVVTRQVQEALRAVPSLGGLVIAYEPVWAIGTGRPATGEGANGVIGFIRQLLGQLYGPEAAQMTRLQYGGSVTAANAAEFLVQPEIDGALVGGASLKVNEFIAIVNQAA